MSIATWRTTSCPEIVLGDDQSGWITDIVYTDSGSGVVKSLKVGGKSFTGNSFRDVYKRQIHSL